MVLGACLTMAVGVIRFAIQSTVESRRMRIKGVVDGAGNGLRCESKRFLQTIKKAARDSLILFTVILLRFLFGFFLFQTHFILADERTELRVVVLLAVQRVVQWAFRMFF